MTDTASLVIKVDSSGAAKASANLDKLDRAAGNSERAANKFGKAWGVAIGLISSAVVIGATRAFIKQADAMANMNAKLKLVTGSTIAATAAQKDLFDLSQKTSSDLEATTNLYVKLGQSSKELAGNHALLLGITEKVSKALVISGADAASSTAVIRQFSQAMAAGALRGDEFISVMEGAPRLAQAIAAGMDVSVGSLRKLAAEGKLTSAAIIKALEDQGDVLDQEFGAMPLTVSRATQQVRNALTLMIGDTSEATGASKKLAESIANLARLLESEDTKRAFASVVGGIVSVSSALITATNKTLEAISALREYLGLADKQSSVMLGNRRNDLEGELFAAQRNAGGGNGMLGATMLPGVGPLVGMAGGLVNASEQARIRNLKNEIAEIDAILESREKKAADDFAKYRGLDPNNGLNVNPNGSPASGGDSPTDGEAAAKRLKAAYDSLNASQRERIALFGDESEVAKVTYAINEGGLKGLSEAKKAGLLQDAKWIDSLEDSAALERVWADSKEEATKIFLDSENAKNEAIVRGRAATDDLIADMESELRITQAQGDEKERLIALRYADAHATDAQVAAVSKLAVELKRAHEREQDIEDVKGAFKGLFVDLSDSSESASKDLDRFFDRLKQKAMEVMADKAINALFGMFSQKDGATSGGGWMAAIMSAFGGGKASGGPVMAGQSYRVGEKGRPEIFTPSQNGTISQAGQGAAVTVNLKIENAPSQPEVSQQRNPSGGVDLMVTFKKQVQSLVKSGIAGGAFDGVAGQAWGVRRMGVSHG